MARKLDIFKYINYHSELEYEEETGLSACVRPGGQYTYEFFQWVVNENSAAVGALEEGELRAWYDANVKVKDVRRAPEITDMMQRAINVYFIKECKFFFNKNNKKTSTDYMLNVDKIIEEKMQCAPPVIFNPVQSFMLNYNIKKMLDKAITIANEKYDNIVYINGIMTQESISNVISHLEKTYSKYEFNYVVLDKDCEFSELSGTRENITIVKSLF